jgi:hypothetical protein
MAIFDVLVWRIDTTYDQPSGKWGSNLGPVNLTAGNYLHVRLDDASGTLSVDYRSAEGETDGSYMGTLTEGPNLFFGYNGAATLMTGAPYYQYCDGTALRKVGSGNLYPYGNLSYEPGAAECVIAPVCDLSFSPFYGYDHATSPTANDGTISVFASSSNGVIKYALNDPTFDYTSEGQTSPSFTGLSPNVYTVYAKDPIGCQDTITIEIGVTENYGIKYRLEFQDSLHESSRLHRIDILERAYEGEILDMCGGGDPVHDKWNGDANNPSKTIIPSEFNLQILKEVFGTYTELFTDDERKFKIIHYVSSAIYWTGYVLPELNNEPWVFEPYYLTISGTDGLGDLKNKPFVDENDNKFKGDQKAIKLIAAILKKCDLDLNIRCGLNIFSVEMTDAATDDPLDQAYIDTRIFLSSTGTPEDCESALDKILAPFRAQLCQSQGYWWIRRLSDAVGTYAYREFDVDGEFVTNSTFAPTQNLDFPSVTNRAAWANKTAFLSHLRNYGYFNILHNLGKDNNLIDEGRFEFDDIEEVSSGNQFFKNWNFFMGQPGVKFGFENVLNGESKGAFFADFETATGPQTDSKLYSIQVPFSSGQGLVKLKFQYFIESRFAGLAYIRLGWSVKVTNGVDSDWMKSEFPPEFSRGNNTDEIINEIYVTSFSTWNTFELTASRLAVSEPATIEVTFYMHNHYGRDFPDIVNLKAFSISDLDDPLRIGKRVLVGEGGLMYVYTSAADATTPESLPDVVLPDDYANDYLWNLDKIINIPPNVGLVKKFLIDNVSLSYYPNAVVNGKNAFIDPPETFSYSEEVSTFVKSDLEVPVFLGDMPRFNDEYEDNERYIYKGYFRTFDGSPTTEWARSGVVESKPLLTITKEDYRDQFTEPKPKLSGTFISDIVWHYVNATQENFEGSRYQFMTFDFDAKKAQYTIDMVATATGEGGEPPVLTGAYSSAYSHAFDHDHILESTPGDGIFDTTFDDSFN